MANNAEGIRAGKAYVEMGTADGPLKAGLDRAKQMVLGFSKTLAGVGGGIAAAGTAVMAPIVASFHEAVSRISNIGKAAQQLGSNAESVSAMGYAAEKAGVDLDGMVGATRRLDRAIASAAQGGAGANLFQKLGLDAKALEDVPIEDKFAAIADALQSLPNETERQAMAMELLGKSGVNLLPILRNGSAGLNELIQRGRDAGAIVSNEDAAKAKEYTKAIGQAKEAVKYFWEAVGSSLLEVAPQIKEYSDTFVGLMRGLREMVENNRSVVVGIAGGAAALVALGTAIVAIGGGIAAVTFGLSAIAGLVGTVAGALVSTPALIVGALAVAAALAVALVADFGDLDKLTGSLGSAWSKLGEVFKSLAGTFEETWGGIRDALAAGDLELAMEVATAGITVVWRKLLNELSGTWKNLQLAWSDTVDFFGDGWDSFVYVMKSTLQSLGDFVFDAFYEIGKTIVHTLLGALAEVQKHTGKGVLGIDANEVIKQLDDRDRQFEKDRDAYRNKRDDQWAKELQEARDARDAARKALEQSGTDGMVAAAKALKEAEEKLAAKRQDAATARAVNQAGRLAEWGLAFARNVHLGRAGAAMSGLADASAGSFSGYAASQVFGLGGSVQQKQLEVLNDIDGKLGAMANDGGGLAFGQ